MKPPRRLQLLPEVLPAPPPAATGAPRERTMKRLSRLLTAATAAAVVSGCRSHKSSDPGYGVVDPMPAPPACDGLAASIPASVRFTPERNVVVTLAAPRMPGATYDAATVEVPGARIARKTAESNSIEVELADYGTLSALSVTITANCPKGRERVVARVQADGTSPLASAKALRVELHDAEF